METSKEKLDAIIEYLNSKEVDVYCSPLYMKSGEEVCLDAIYIDGDISFDVMAKVLEMAKID